MATRATTAARSGNAGITLSLVGWLFLVELTSGILQGYYPVLIPDIVKYLGVRDADYNWFEAAQLAVSAISIPVLAKLGDRFGHNRILLVSTLVTAAATWWLAFAPTFTTYLIAFAIQGFYTVWLGLEVAIIFDRGRRSDVGVSHTRRAAGWLIVALELGAILGDLAAAQLFESTGSIPISLIVPAACVTLVFFAIWLGVPASEPVPTGERIDSLGFALLALALVLITGGLALLRALGPGDVWVWVAIAAGLLTLWPFARVELRSKDPGIDLRVMRRSTMWPIIVTAGLIGISVLGAQTPLSTFAGTDPQTAGFGLGLGSGMRSILIGVYLVSLIIGATVFPTISAKASPRAAMILGAALVAIGYLALLPFHTSLLEVLGDIVIAGFGTGALLGALPAAAAAAAPHGQTGAASAMTNTTKIIGGGIASAVFGVALATGASDAADSTAASLAGYYTVWAICGLGGVAATILLFFVPKAAFADRPAED